MLRKIALIGALGGCLSVAAPVTAQQAFPADSVISTCAAVLEAERRAAETGVTNMLRGECIGSTQSFLTLVISLAPSQEILDQTIGNIVVELTNLLLGPDCLINSELSEAIGYSGSLSSDPFLQDQISLVAATIGDCEIFTTASIDALQNFGFGGFNEGGTPASSN